MPHTHAHTLTHTEISMFTLVYRCVYIPRHMYVLTSFTRACSCTVHNMHTVVVGADTP